METTDYTAGRMTIVSQHEILCQDLNTYSALKILDCSKPFPEIKLYQHIANNKKITDLCLTTDKDNQLILMCICENCDDIFAYNTTGKLLWSIQGAVSGKEMIKCVSFTTDHKGHLFVCDTNNKCIHMFSTDGLFLGCLVDRGQHGITDPRHVRWCKNTSSLVVVHCKNEGTWFTSILKTNR